MSVCRGYRTRIYWPHTGDRLTVLLIEDDPDVRVFLVSHFGRIPGLVLDVANSGSEGLGKCITAAYDLILLDLHLPDGGGLDILPVLRSSLPQAVMAMISGYTDLVTEVDFAVADTVISKPFDLSSIDDLVCTTREILKCRARIRSLGIT